VSFRCICTDIHSFFISFSFLFLCANFIFLAGTIPIELSKLTHLEIIDLYANQLSGTVGR